VPVWRHFQPPQVADERFGFRKPELRRVADRVLVQEPEQVVGGGPVPVDRVDRRPQDVLVVVDPPLS
jgi:hypothetical protein